jgi:hypothetical protein
MKLSEELLSLIFSSLFGAGVAYATMREKLRKNSLDLNGLGRKLGRMTALLIRWADTEEKREQLANAVEPR